MPVDPLLAEPPPADWAEPGAVPRSAPPRPATVPFDRLGGRPWSLWRYAEALPFTDDRWGGAVTLGEGATPLVPFGDRPGLWAKVEFASPTLSFKDRGAAVLVAKALEWRVDRLLCDSSGNAGTALAAYCARAGIECHVVVPAATRPAKLAAARAHGAHVHLVEGSRADVAAAAIDAVARGGVFYGSHVWQPVFLEGTKTVAYELVEQLGRPPDTVVVPAGNGTLLLGVAKGFAELASAGVVASVPRLVAVQAAACAPVAHQAGVGGPGPWGDTVADGIAVAAPPRRAEMVAAVAATGGRWLTVTDDEVLAARDRLARRGWFVEPTGAVAVAAAARLDPGGADGEVVVPLCGAGLKAVA